MQSLPLALARSGRLSVRCDSLVVALHHGNPAPAGLAWKVVVAGDAEPILAHGVILAGEPWAMAPLVRPIDQGAAAELEANACPPIAVVAFGFDAAHATRVPAGFGVLISRDEGFRMLGNVWESHLYPARSPEGCVLMRVMLGGAVDPGIATLSDDEVLQLARDEVTRLYGLTAPPILARVERVPCAIPQYEIGHGDLVARIEQALACHPTLDMTGFGLRGIAFADAASDGVAVGERVAARLLGAVARTVATG